MNAENIIAKYEVISTHLIPIEVPDNVEDKDIGIKNINVTFLLDGFEYYNHTGIYESEIWTRVESVTYRYEKYTHEGNIIIRKWIDNNYRMLLGRLVDHIKYVKYMKGKKNELRNYKNYID